MITPRFAITSTPEQMEMAEALAREYPDYHIQTHVDENLAEIEFATELFPNLPDYLGHLRALSSARAEDAARATAST